MMDVIVAIDENGSAIYMSDVYPSYDYEEEKSEGGQTK